MKAPLPSLFLALVLATDAAGQIGIPPHSIVYNGFSRGFHFVAATDFLITSLDLPPEALQPDHTASYLVRIDGTTVFYGTGHSVPVQTLIPVTMGNAVDVIGNWSPAFPNNFTARNSFGLSAPYATTIEGVPHTLYRTGWQWDIGDPAWSTSAAYLQPNSGSMGRILVGTAPADSLFARFTANVRSGASPLTVTFTDTSHSADPGGVQGWAWDFENDGIVDSTAQNPTHTFATCGVYDVSLTVTDATHPPATHTEPGYVMVDTVAADFTWAWIAPDTVQLTDTTVPAATSWAWDFQNDGIVDSTLQNPTAVHPPGTSLVECALSARLRCGPADTATRWVIPQQNLATTFAGREVSSNSGSGNLFDLTVTNPLGVTITGVFVLPWPHGSGLVSMDVYLTDAPGGYAANHANGAVWRRVATGWSTAAIPVMVLRPVEMTLSNRIHIAPGSYSMAVHLSGAGIVHTPGNGANQTYGNADLSIACGIAKLFPFSGTTLGPPAVWNGALLYDDCTTGGLAGYGFLASGCAGSAGVAGLRATSDPVLGGNLSIDVGTLPDNAAFMMLGLSRTTSPLGPLPLDLTPLGAPGCFGRVSPDDAVFLLGTAGTATYGLGIPNEVALLCTTFFNQALVLDAGHNALGAVVSDAGAGIIGN